MAASVLDEVRLSYREAARHMRRDRRTIADIARARDLAKSDGKPLDLEGYRAIARILNASPRLELIRA